MIILFASLAGAALFFVAGCALMALRQRDVLAAAEQTLRAQAGKGLVLVHLVHRQPLDVLGQRRLDGGGVLVILEHHARQGIGMRMRRGVIAIKGKVRDFAGLQMKGGTIVLMAGAEIRTGAWMVRGTIISLTPLRLLPTFAFELGNFRTRDAGGRPGTSNDTRAMLVLSLNLLNGGSDVAQVRSLTNASRRSSSAARSRAACSSLQPGASGPLLMRRISSAEKPAFCAASA